MTWTWSRPWRTALEEHERLLSRARSIRRNVASDWIGAAHPDALKRAARCEEQAQEVLVVAVLEWLLWSSADDARYIGWGRR